VVADHFAASRLRLLTPPSLPSPCAWRGNPANPSGKARHGSVNVRGRLIPRFARACALREVWFEVGLFLVFKTRAKPEKSLVPCGVRGTGRRPATAPVRRQAKRVSVAAKPPTCQPCFTGLGWGGLGGEGFGSNFPWPSQCQDKHQTDSNVFHTTFRVVGEMCIGSVVFLPF
jgi:hypothetical protein